MNIERFDELTHLLAAVPSRRDILRGLIATALGLGLGIGRRQNASEARKKRNHNHNHKHKHQKATLNAFGCLDVSQPCTRADHCCSGICAGNKGRRTCRAHDAGTCVQGTPGICTAQNPSLSICNNSSTCACFRTTAGSNICAELFGQDLSACAECQRDADCAARGFPLGTACAPVSEGECTLLCPSGLACLVPCGVKPPA